MSIDKQEMLQTVGYENPDEALELPIVTSPIEKKMNMVLNCAYGFGGVNSCLIVEKP
jgi:3-oxoacyl-(acyl-carrier-protein) synthase